jgi:hypothetical protein
MENKIRKQKLELVLNRKGEILFKKFHQTMLLLISPKIARSIQKKEPC